MKLRTVSMLVLPAVLAGGVLGFLGMRDGRTWRDGTCHGRWCTEYTGYGRVSGGEHTVRLAPRAPRSPEETHAALVISRERYADLALSLRVRTEEQLRPGTPNPWEVGWVVWHYADSHHFYALTLKPNGWELSKQDPDYPGGQRFLVSDHSPTFAVGSWHEVGIVQVGAVIKVTADGRALATFTDTERPYLDGAVGLYTEDARVTFDGLDATPLPTDPKGTHRP